MQTRAQVLLIFSAEHKQNGRLSVFVRWTFHLFPISSCTPCPSPRSYAHAHTRCVVTDICSLPIITSLSCCFFTLRFPFLVAPVLPHASHSVPLVPCLAVCIGMPVSCSCQSEAVALSRYIIDAHSTLTNSRIHLRAQTQKRRPPASHNKNIRALIKSNTVA